VRQAVRWGQHFVVVRLDRHFKPIAAVLTPLIELQTQKGSDERSSVERAAVDSARFHVPVIASQGGSENETAKQIIQINAPGDKHVQFTKICSRSKMMSVFLGPKSPDRFRRLLTHISSTVNKMK
jgi:hypothetical protein